MPTLQVIKDNAEAAAVAVRRLKQLYTDQRAHAWNQGQRDAADDILARLAALRQYYGATSGEINDIITAISTEAAVDAAAAAAQGEAPDFAAVTAEIQGLEDEIGVAGAAVPGAAVPGAAVPPPGPGPPPPGPGPGGPPPAGPPARPGAGPRHFDGRPPSVGFGSGVGRGLGGGFRYSPKKRRRTTTGSSHKKTKSGRTSTRRRRKRSSIHGGSRASRRRRSRSARSRSARSRHSRSARSRSSHRRRKH